MEEGVGVGERGRGEGGRNISVLVCFDKLFVCLHVSNVRDDTEDVQCIAYLFFIIIF